MYLELPEFKRCCCFLPVRLGIIVFGYLHMVLSFLVIFLESWLLARAEQPSATSRVVSVFHGVGFVVQVWVVFLLYAVDVVFCAVLLIGAHRKNPRLLKVYAYYAIGTCCGSLVLFIIMRFQLEYLDMLVYLTITETCLAAAALGLKIYLLLLIRREVKKLERHCELRFSLKPEEGNPF